MFKRFKVTGINENPKKPKRNFMKYLALGCVMALPAFALLKTGVLSMHKNVLAADKNKYDIVADLDGGKFEMGTTPEFTKMDNGNWLYKYKPVPTPTKLPVPVKDGYDFTGWTVGSDSAVKPEYSIPAWHKGNLNVKANWKSKGATLVRSGSFFSEIYNLCDAEIKNIVFEYKIPSDVKNYSPVDLSEAKDKSILGYKKGDTCYIVSNVEILANADTSYMFGGPFTPEIMNSRAGASLYRIENIKFNNFNTSKVTDMHGMFYGCAALKNLNLSNFDTSKVTNMGSMFSGCSGLVSLDLSNFDTSKVTNMGSMFSGCSSIVDLNLKGFDVSSVTDMEYMFNSCLSLITLDLSGFSTRTLQSARSMFYNCTSLEKIIGIESFRTGFLKNYNNMFQDCHRLSGEIKINKSGYSVYSNMFTGCSTDPNAKFYVKFKDDATKEIARKMVATKSSNSNVFLYETSRLVDGKTFNNIIDLYDAWETGHPLSRLLFRSGNVPANAENVTDVSEAQDGSIKLYTLDSGINQNTKAIPPHNNIYITSNKIIQFNEDCSGMFENIGFSSIYFSNIGKSNIKSMENMFKNSYICNSNLEVLDLSSVTNMNNMFNGSHAITDYITINNPNITSYTDMFKGCSTDPYAKFIVKYTSPETRKVAEKMVATKSSNSHVYLDGTQSAELVSGRDFNTKISAMPDFGSVTEIRFIKGKPDSDGVDVGIYPDEIKASINGNVLTVASEYEIFANPDCSSMFISYTPPHNGGTNRMLPHANLSSIEFNNFNTSNVTDMGGMFTNCISLTSLDLHNFNTSNVTDMGGMFNSCARLEKINVSGWDTSKVTNMSYMFDTTDATYPRSNIKQIIGLDNFDTSSVTKMARMLYGCRYLSGEITISNSNISMYDQMFSGCSTDPNAKFIVKYKDAATKEVARKMVATKSSDSNVELYSIPSTLVDGQTFNQKFNSVSGFQKATEIKFLRGKPNMSGVDLSEAQDKSIMGAFNGTVFEVVCDGKMYANPDCSSMFYNIGVSDDDSTLSYNVKTIRFDNFDTSKVTNMGDMFYVFRPMARSQIVNLYGIENWDVSNVTDMHRMFYDRGSLTSLNLSKWKTDNLISMNHMFYRCEALKTLDVSNFNVSGVDIFSSVFNGCTALTNLNLENWKFSKDVKSVTYMFSRCSNLTATLTINAGSSFVGEHVYHYMFDGCSTASGSKFTVKYEDETVKSFAEQMVATKSSNSNVFLVGPPKPAILVDGRTFNQKLNSVMSSADSMDPFRIYFIKKSQLSETIPQDAIDVSEAKDGSIMMYASYKEPNNTRFIGSQNYIIVVSDQEIYTNEDSRNLLDTGHWNLYVECMDNLNTSRTANMSYMFANLEYISLTDLDMSKATDTSHMFENVSGLVGEITINNSDVTAYVDMFKNSAMSSSDKFIVKYKDETTRRIAEKMVATKSSNSSVYLDGTQPQPNVLVDGKTFNAAIKCDGDFNFITFSQNYPSQIPSDAIDLSVAKDKSIILIVSHDARSVKAPDPGLYVYYTIYCKDVIKLNENCSGMFDGLVNVASITLSNLDASNVRNASNMFSNISGNTPGLIGMISVFDGFNDLKFSSVTNINDMFNNSDVLYLVDRMTIRNSNITNYKNVGLKYLDYISKETKVMAESVINDPTNAGMQLGNLLGNAGYTGSTNRDLTQGSDKPAPTSYAAAHQNTKPATPQPTHQVNITLNNGSMAMYPVQKIQTKAGKIGDLPKPDLNPKYAGQFGGYYYDKNCTIPVKPNDIVTQDIELYAKW